MINNEEELYISQEIIILLDKLIQSTAIYIDKLQDEYEIIDFQYKLKNLREKRLAFFNDIFEYTYKKDKEAKSNEEIYTVVEGITLVDISNAYYGKPNYAMSIYKENDLKSTLLTVGQRLIIPKLDKINTIVGNEDITRAELENIVIYGV